MDTNEPSAWEEIGAQPRGTVVQLTPRNASSPATTPDNLVPATMPEFIKALTPCLQLCAPVGMTIEDKDTWFDAAYMAVGHLPPDILRDAALSAMQTADHPAKIVPAIMREAGERIESRKRFAETINRYSALPAPTPDNRSPEEREGIAKTMGQLVERMKATAPSVDDLLGKPAA